MLLYRKLVLYTCLFFGCLIVAVRPVWAARAGGEFNATHACPAYISKNKLSNPDSILLDPGRSYGVWEANRAHKPKWYRIQVPAASPKLRWVKADCGSFDGVLQLPSSKPKCNAPDEQDSYLLALTWLPAFCEINPGKPECKKAAPSAVQSPSFTLHGLWPNKYSCGISYGFCGEVNRSEQNFCDYPKIPLSASIRSSLEWVMPGMKVGSCLYRHQWYKHGVCQTNWTAEMYFGLSVELARWFNESGLSKYMTGVADRMVQVNEFLDEIERELGESVRNKVVLICKREILVEIRLSLGANLAPGIDPRELIQQAPAVKKKSNCGKTFKVKRTISG